MLDKQERPDPAVQPNAKSSAPGVEYSHPTHCPSCNRRFDEAEKRSSYGGVEVCAACKALQQVGDLSGLFAVIFESQAMEIERLRSTVSGLSARERV